MEIDKPNALPFVCHLNFSAPGGSHGDIIQVSLKFSVKVTQIILNHDYSKVIETILCIFYSSLFWKMSIICDFMKKTFLTSIKNYYDEWKKETGMWTFHENFQFPL